MSFASSHDAKEEVKRATDIVELVGSYLPLRRDGVGFAGLCPWHNDRRPSLKVNPGRQSYRCFVCDEGGDVFSFVMKIEGISFPEALEMLAERAGVTLRGRGKSPDQPANQRKTLYEALRWAESEYHRFLLESPEAEPGRAYLAGRGINAESIGRFLLGLAPNRWDWLRSRNPPQAITTEVLERAGLLGAGRETGRPFDRFKGRLLFSIRDPQGRPVGSGGRLVPGIELSSQAKYVNSPETPLFEKSNLLYGLDLARETIRRTETAIVVEGYTDVIMAHQHGFTNTVAVLGTALGKGHIRLLSRYQAQRVVLVLDGDEAGQRRANEILELFLDSELDLRILTLPEGLDPCDFLLQRGREAMSELIDRAVDALEHRLSGALRHLEVNDTHAVQRAVEGVLATLSKARNVNDPTALRVKEDQIIFRLSRRTGISKQRLNERLAALRRGGRRPMGNEPLSDEEPDRDARKPINPRERELIEILLIEPEALVAIRQDVRPEQIENADCRQIYETACRLADAGMAPSLDRLLLEIDEPRIKGRLVELDELGRDKTNTDLAARIRALIDLFQRRDHRHEQRSAIDTLKQTPLAEKEEAELLDRLIRSERSRQRISEPTDG